MSPWWLHGPWGQKVLHGGWARVQGARSVRGADTYSCAWGGSLELVGLSNRTAHPRGAYRARVDTRAKPSRPPLTFYWTARLAQTRLTSLRRNRTSATRTKGTSCSRWKKSGNICRVGIFLDFVWLTTRTMHPHGAYVRRAERNRIDRHWGGIERIRYCCSHPDNTLLDPTLGEDNQQQVRGS